MSKYQCNVSSAELLLNIGAEWTLTPMNEARSSFKLFDCLDLCQNFRTSNLKVMLTLFLPKFTFIVV